MNPDLPPPLPDGQDPYEILGVGRDADELELKRAYTRQIRLYRPDRSPEEFQRVRKAYEEALYRRAFEDEEDEDDLDDESVGEDEDDGRDAEDEEDDEEFQIPRPPDPVVEGVRSAWTHASQGRGDVAEALLETRIAEHPQEPALHAARFLLRESLGRADEAFGDLSAAFPQCPELAAWCVGVFSELEGGRLASHAGLELPAIVRQHNRDGAIALMWRRISALLQMDRADLLVEEARHPDVRQAARHATALTGPLLHVASVTAWSHPEEAADLFERTATHATDVTWWEDAYEARVRTRPAYERWARSHENVPTLDRYLRIAEGLTPEVEAEERRRLARAARRDPETYANALFDLGKEDEELYVLLHDALGDDLAEEETSDDDTDEAEDGPALPPLSAGTKIKIRDALRATDKALSRDFVNSASSYLIGAAVIATIYLFAAHGAWGWLGLAGVLGSFALSLGLGDRRLYRKIVRPRVARIIANTLCTPQELLRELKSMTKFSDDIGRFDDEIADDPALALLAHTLRVFR